MSIKHIGIGFSLSAILISSSVLAHYPVLDCKHTDSSGEDMVVCEAGFSNRSKAPNVIMEVFSEDDDVLVSGTTDDNAMFEFVEPEGGYFIFMDAGPGHILEISNEEVTREL